MKKLLVGLVLALAFCTVAEAQTIGYSGTNVIAMGVNMNAAATDVATLNIGWPKYVVRRITVYDASATPVAATLGVFTAAGGGGTTVVTLATITALTGATKRVDATLALSTDYLTAPQLFIRCGVAQGSGLTVTVLVEIQPIL